MNAKRWLIIYVLLTVLEVIFTFLKSDLGELILKPLLMPALIVWVLAVTRSRPVKSRNLLVTALVFSFLGDVFLLFVSKNEVFFLLGLGSFLVAQVIYTLLFSAQRSSSLKLFHFLIVALFLTFYAGLMALLYPNLDDFLIPVLIYGFVITLMGVTAALRTRNNIASHQFVLLGALTFILSDTLIALNQFCFPHGFYQAQTFIMITYCLAQYLIVKGLLPNQMKASEVR